MYKNVVKPFFDFVLAVVVLTASLPILLVLLIILYFQNKGTPFFTQQRPGLHGKLFQLIKFKTMRDAFDASGNPLPDKERITPIGLWVRKLSLDELPQLINVLKGDMSLVGPRPLLVSYLPLYSVFQKRRHDVKPGITGWAQVNGRNSISWQEKFALDVWYVDHVSFLLDLKIVWLTLLKVIQSKDVNQAGEGTMSRFEGDV